MAEISYNSTYRQIRRIDPSFAVIRSANRNINWEDVNWLREQLWNARMRAATQSECEGGTGGIPENWIRRPSRTGGGFRYTDPNNSHNSVRVMPGDPNSPYPNSRMPYVRWLRNGQSLDVNGNVVSHNSPDAHIPVQIFRYKE